MRLDFIVGMARSGTTWLGKTLAEHPDVAVFGETSFWGRLFVPPRPDGTYGPRELARVADIQRRQEWTATTGDRTGCLRNTPPEDYAALVDAAFADMRAPITPAEAFRRIACAVARSEQTAHVIEKTPHHVHWLPRLAVAFPQARFVILVRDPYEFMLSFLHLGDRLPSATERWADRSWRHPLIASVAWRAYMLSAERALRDVPSRTLLLETRELLAQPQDALDRVQGFLGLEPHDLTADPLRRNSSFAGTAKPRLTAGDVFWMNTVAGGLVRRHGLDRRPVGFHPLAVGRTFLTLPFSAAVTAVRLPRMVQGSLPDYLARWAGASRGD